MPELLRVLVQLPEAWVSAGVPSLVGGSGREVTVVPADGTLSEPPEGQARVALVVLGAPDALPAGTLEQLSTWTPPPAVLLLYGADAARSVQSAVLGGVHMVLPFGVAGTGAVKSGASTLLDAWRLRHQLAVTEAQYKDLLENTRDAIYILGPTRFTFVNRAFEELIGFRSDEICSESFDYMRLIAPESRPMIMERARLSALGEQLPPRYEFMALNEAGQRLDVAVSVSYIVFNGQPSSLGVLQDITARKQYEKALLRRNRELAVLNDLAATVSRASDLGTVLEMAVERLIAVMGFSAAGISLLDGRTVKARLYRGVTPEQMDRLKEMPIAEGVVGETLRTGEVQVVHDTVADDRTDGSLVHVVGFRSAVCVPIQAKDRVLGAALGLCADVRQFAPEELSLLLSIGHQLGTAVERATLHENREAAMQRLLALDELARALSSTLNLQEVFRVAAVQLQRVLRAQAVELCLMRNGEADGPDAAMEVAMRRTGSRWEVGGKVLRRNNDAAWRGLDAGAPGVVEINETTHGPWAREGLRATAAAPLVLDGKAIGVVLAGFVEPQRAHEASEFLGSVGAHLALAWRNARLFSDLEGAFRDLKEAKDQLVMQEKLSALGEMSAGVAHDFNNVLGAILGRTQLLKTFVSDSTVQKSLGIIERAALDGAATVRRIQEFARWGGEEDFEPVDLDQVVHQAVELTQSRWQARAQTDGVTIRLAVETQAPPPVLGNPQELREVLTNLVHNACDALPQGGTVTVRTGQVDGRCFISVSDSGTGIPPEIRSRVFDPFFTTKGSKGTGLGLSVSYGIMQRHHGELALDSEVGKGTTFTLWLPEAGPDSVEAEQADAASAPQTDGASARVLIIDDEENIRDVLADMLRAAAHHVDMAPDGQSALDQLDQLVAAGLDVVFTDLGMPGMNGWEVVAEVKRRHPQLPVGLITGWGATLDAEKMRSHGVDLVVPKPFRFDQVTSVVAEALQLHRARRTASS